MNRYGYHGTNIREQHFDRGMKAVIIVNRIILGWKRFHRQHEKNLIDRDIKYINLFTG